MLHHVLRPKLVTCEPDAKVSEVARLMAKEDVGSVLILSNGKPRGIITDRDIVVRCLAKSVDVDDTTVENVMTESPHSVPIDAGLFDCIREMKKAGVRRLPVVDDNGKAVGIISFGDLLSLLGKELNALTETTTPPVEKAA